MLSIRRVIRVGGAAILLLSGLVVGVLSSSPTASASGSVWSIVPSPNTSPTQINQLNAVSCSGPSACVAVGIYATPEANPPYNTPPQTLIESWNGSAWSIVPSPDTSSTLDNALSAVSCSSPSACVAVGGQTGASAHAQTLIESWNGSAWSIVPSPNISASQDDGLSGVSCSGPSSCVAVGANLPAGSADQTLTELWNGSVWSIVPSPNTSASQDNELDAVSCSGPSACVAVGQYYLSPIVSQTLIESWNGSAWSIVPSPNNGSQTNLLRGVSCNNPSACTAIGSYAPSGGSDQTLIESWNGSVWSIVTSPNTSPTQNDELSGVSCTSSSACTAAGYYLLASSDGSASEQTLIESWNGSAWSIVTSPNASPTNLLEGVSCNGSSVCTAVGDNGSGTEQTLIEKGIVPTTTSVLIPSSGATLSGSTILDASASNATSVEFLLFGGPYGYAAPVVCTATQTYYGWLCSWITTDVPNGSYGLVSEASGAGGSAFSSGVGITVSNPPTTSVLFPSSGATLSGSTTLDASASNATSVEFRIFGGIYGYSAPVLCTATLTYYGWLCSWDTTKVPNGSYALLSEAFNSGGSAFSSGVGITVSN